MTLKFSVLDPTSLISLALCRLILTNLTDPSFSRIHLLTFICKSLLFRDAVAKILYSLLFHWLTERINAQVYPGQHGPSISILDIYGFEVRTFFLTSSFYDNNNKIDKRNYFEELKKDLNSKAFYFTWHKKLKLNFTWHS